MRYSIWMLHFFGTAKTVVIYAFFSYRLNYFNATKAFALGEIADQVMIPVLLNEQSALVFKALLFLLIGFLRFSKKLENFSMAWRFVSSARIICFL